jgi:hypothetical protein
VHSRTQVKEQAQEDARQAETATLCDDVSAVVEQAWQNGMPINREGLKVRVRRNRSNVIGAIEMLLAECWLHDVLVPPTERTHPKRKSFLVSLTPVEREAWVRGEGLLAAKLAVPASWRKPVISSVPDIQVTRAHLQVAEAGEDELSSVPDSSVTLKENTCGTDGWGLDAPHPPSVPDEFSTRAVRMGTVGNGRAGQHSGIQVSG